MNPDEPSPEQINFDRFDDWPIPKDRATSPKFDTLNAHIWSETKAQLIRNYLNYFGWVTKHGCYIDGFAGPQNRSEPDSWAAKLVLEITPPFLRDFYLSELNPDSFALLEDLAASQPARANRHIKTYLGDFNVFVDEFLATGNITDNTATFALLDQRTFECHWSSVEKLARHKEGDTKIELFYFFPTGWINRSLSRTTDANKLLAWWGKEGWKGLEKMRPIEAMLLVRDRLLALGYRSVTPWPITRERSGEGRTMYHMIHATDHKRAPFLMQMAYRKIVSNEQEREAIRLWESQQVLDL